MTEKQKCVRCGKPLSRFEAHEMTHCIEWLRGELELTREALKFSQSYWMQAIEERDRLALTIGHVYMAISKIVADPPGNDTAILIDIMTTIDKVLGKDGK